MPSTPIVNPDSDFCLVYEQMEVNNGYKNETSAGHYCMSPGLTAGDMPSDLDVDWSYKLLPPTPTKSTTGEDRGWRPSLFPNPMGS